jgi:hypothetical protein
MITTKQGKSPASRIQPHAKSGGARRDRTDDLLLAKQALSQLSYGPPQDAEDFRRDPDNRHLAPGATSGFDGLDWWAWEDLNLRPHAYQARALTN